MNQLTISNLILDSYFLAYIQRAVLYHPSSGKSTALLLYNIPSHENTLARLKQLLRT